MPTITKVIVLPVLLVLQVPMSDADDEGLDNESDKQVIVGICAMAKKSESKPMKEILTRLDDFEYIQTLVFPEETILKVTESFLLC